MHESRAFTDADSFPAGLEIAVIDFGVTGGVNGEAGLRELWDVFAGEGKAVVGHQKKPVSTIGDVTGDCASLHGSR